MSAAPQFMATVYRTRKGATHGACVLVEKIEDEETYAELVGRERLYPWSPIPPKPSLWRRFVDWLWEPYTKLSDEERAENQIYGGP